MGRNTLSSRCLLARIVDALQEEDYDTASDLQVEMKEKVEELRRLYKIYNTNLF